MCILNSQLNSIPLFPCRMPCTISHGHTLWDHEKILHLSPRYIWQVQLRMAAVKRVNEPVLLGRVFSDVCSYFACNIKEYSGNGVGGNHTHTHTHTRTHTQGKTLHFNLGSKSDLCRNNERESASCSVMSNFLGPHRLEPTRLFCPWNFPGKKTGVASHSHLQRVFLNQTLDHAVKSFL